MLILGLCFIIDCVNFFSLTFSEETGHRQQALVPFDEETHGGQDVMVYARGPMAHLFHGVQEQSYIPHVIRYAACLAGETEHCTNGQARWCEGGTASASMSSKTKEQAEVEAHVGASAVRRTHGGMFQVIACAFLASCIRWMLHSTA